MATPYLSNPSRGEDAQARQPDLVGIEEIEGLSEPSPEDSAWADFPLDSFLIRTDSRTIHDVLRRIKKGGFVMAPTFQRDFIWPKDKQSKLIESVIMRIPLPVFYLAEDQEGRMVVVDGLQRLSTFQRFINNELSLHLKGRPELHGKRFKDLSPQLQNRIEDCNLTLYTIDARAPERARLELFDRVNSGEPLSRQQMRNSLFTGEATKFLRKESRSKIFFKATDRSLKTRTMRDREFVNRFCAFQLIDIEEYQDMDEFLAQALEKMNKNPTLLPGLSKQFRNGLQNNYALFGKDAFRKLRPPGTRRSVINAALWDVMSTGLSRYPERMVRMKKARLIKGYRELLNGDERFERAITLSTGSVRRVKYRFMASRRMLLEAFND